MTRAVALFRGLPRRRTFTFVAPAGGVLQALTQARFSLVDKAWRDQLLSIRSGAQRTSAPVLVR
jgi:hypothetical protein